MIPTTLSSNLLIHCCRNWNKYLAIFLCFALLGSHACISKAQEMEVVLVGDLTEQAGIGGGVQQDLTRVFNELKFIANALELDFQCQTLDKASEFDRRSVLKALKAVSPQAEVLVFYYSGHGSCSEDDPLPYLQLYGGLHIQDVLEQVRRKNARLSLVLTDCCNGPPPKEYNSQATVKSMLTPRQQRNYRHLFGEFKGEIIATASRYQQDAYIGPAGSYFTQAFFEVLPQMARAQETLSWKAVLDAASQRTQERVYKAKLANQQPYYILNLNQR